MLRYQCCDEASCEYRKLSSQPCLKLRVWCMRCSWTCACLKLHVWDSLHTVWIGMVDYYGIYKTLKQTRQRLYTTTDPNDVEHLSDATNRLGDFPSRAFDQGIPEGDQGDAAFLVEFSHWPAQPSICSNNLSTPVGQESESRSEETASGESQNPPNDSETRCSVLIHSCWLYSLSIL